MSNQPEPGGDGSRITPEERLTQLNPWDVFVFGSNTAGRHGKGAALDAVNFFGAKAGRGVGQAGQSYAIPTKDDHLNPLPLATIGQYVSEFISHARSDPEHRYLVTKIGCGLAGYTAKEIAPLFFTGHGSVPTNVLLPAEFWKYEPPAPSDERRRNKIDKLVVEPLDFGDGDILDIAHYLGSEYDDVSVANQELPPMMEWVHSKLQLMTERRLLVKQRVAEHRARAWFALQDDGADGFSANYRGKATSEAMNHAVNLDPRVCEAERLLARYTGWTQRLNNLCESIQAKLDLVRSTEATRRRVFDDHAE